MYLFQLRLTITDSYLEERYRFHILTNEEREEREEPIIAGYEFEDFNEIGEF